MIGGLLITWSFWIIMIAMLIYWKRSWVNMVAIPIVLSIGIVILNLISKKLAFLVPLILHLLLTSSLVLAIVRSKGKNDWKRPV